MKPPRRMTLALVAPVALLAGVVVSNAAPSASPTAVERSVESVQVGGAPVPDPATLLERVRERIRRDLETESPFTYVETRRKHKTGRDGKRMLEEERVTEVYPRFGPHGRYRRLVSLNGQAVPADELERRDRRRREQLVRAEQELASESPAERARREQRRAQKIQEDLEEVEEALGTFDYTIVGRTTFAGRPALVVDLVPKANPPRARTRVGRALRQVKGRAIVTEADAHVVRVDLEAVSTISVGWGLIARIHEGSRASFEQRLVNGEVWLPAKATLQASGRAALVKGLAYDLETTWSDYRKFTTDAQITSIGTPRPD